MQQHDIIFKWRMANGYKQLYVAAELGITQQAFSKIESGLTKLSKVQKAKLQKLPGLPLSQFEEAQPQQNNKELTPEKEIYYLKTINKLQQKVISLQDKKLNRRGGRGKKGEKVGREERRERCLVLK